MQPESTQLREAVNSLASKDSKTRVAATKILLGAGLREFSGVRKDVLASDEAWNGLIEALGDSDTKVVENASGALAQVIGRYRRDSAAFEPLRRLVTSKNKQVRMFAVRGLGYLNHPDRWTVLLPLLDDKSEPVSKESVLAMVHSAQEMSAAERVRAKQILERIAPTAGPELKMIAENAIQVLSSVRN